MSAIGQTERATQNRVIALFRERLHYDNLNIEAGLRAACRMALVRPITDDADIRDTLDHAIDAVFG